MRIRFTASDMGSSNVVEAGVDGFDVFVASCSTDEILGDINLDGVVNLLDVAPFVALIQNGQFQVEADINCDGVVNLLDIAPFVELLIGQ